MNLRKLSMAVSFVVFTFFILNTMLNIKVNPGISELYNIVGQKIAPNMVTVILFDFRGYDTLGEAIILVSGVLAVSLLYGRGVLGGDALDEAEAELKSTMILRMITPLVISLIVALGVYVTLGGHITPGGGFQGGSIIAAGIFLTLVIYGRQAVHMPHSLLVKMEALGVLLYIGLGLIGLLYSGYFLYNLGVDLYGIAPTDLVPIFNYPDNINAGIIPYLNIAVLIKVSASLTTVMLILLGGKR